MRKLYSVMFISLMFLMLTSCADCKKDILQKRNSNNEKLRELKNELREALLLVKEKDDGTLKKLKEKREAIKRHREFVLAGDYKPKQYLKSSKKRIESLNAQIAPMEKAKKNIKTIKDRIHKTEDENAKYTRSEAQYTIEVVNKP